MTAAELERCRPWLEAAVKRSPGESLPPATVEILAGRAQLWAGDRYAMVTQLVLMPHERTFHVWLCGGDLDEAMAARPTIESWARQQGAQAITIRGRRGWARVLKPFGYTTTNHELRKAL